MKTTDSLMDELNDFIAANMAVETIEWTDRSFQSFQKMLREYTEIYETENSKLTAYLRRMRTKKDVVFMYRVRNATLFLGMILLLNGYRLAHDSLAVYSFPIRIMGFTFGVIFMILAAVTLVGVFIAFRKLQKAVIVCTAEEKNQIVVKLQQLMQPTSLLEYFVKPGYSLTIYELMQKAIDNHKALYQSDIPDGA